MARTRATTPAGQAPPVRARAGPITWLAGALPPFVMYVLTLHPGLAGGDSGELVTVAATGGVAHPPGYPLYTMLAGLWLRIVPWGSEAWRLNLFSAALMAAAAGVLALAVARVSGSRSSGVIAAWAFAFLAPAWRYALVAEVFALHALLAAATLWALAGIGERGRERRTLFALSFLAVLSLSHHHTLLMLALPATFASLPSAWRASKGDRARFVRDGAAIKLLALAPLLWLPFAAARSGALRWGDAGTFRGFAALLLRAEYGTWQLAPEGSRAGFGAGALVHFLRSLPSVAGPAVLVLACAGAWRLARRSPGAAAALALFAALQAWFYTRVGFSTDVAVLRGVVERFAILPLLVLVFLAGLGLAAVLGAARGRARAVLALAIAVATLGPAIARAPRMSERGNRDVEALGRALLAGLPDRAVVFVRGDLFHNSLEYLTRVRGVRGDVTVIDQELLTYDWYVRQVRSRDPDLLPPLGRAQRITLRQGGERDGFAIPRADGTTDVLTEAGQETLPEGAIVAVREAPAGSLFLSSRATFIRRWPLAPGEDRYSGLPGTRSLLWLDHLAGRRPVAMVGTKDDSWRLRYQLTPVAFTAWVSPRGSEPGVAEQARATLAALEQLPLAAYFRVAEPTSFEAAERARLAGMASRAALVLSQPEAAGAIRARLAGHRELLAFASRFEPLDPSPDPRCLRAIGFLRLCDPVSADTLAGRRDLERWLASGDAAAASDVEARAALASTSHRPPASIGRAERRPREKRRTDERFR